MLHVIDARNIERMLPMTLQLIEAGLPIILVVNILDEAERLGMQFDLKKLQKNLTYFATGLHCLFPSLSVVILS